jgi:hypothetical protein
MKNVPWHVREKNQICHYPLCLSHFVGPVPGQYYFAHNVNIIDIEM